MTPDVQNAYYGSMGTLIIGILTMLGGVVFFALAGSSATNESARVGKFLFEKEDYCRKKGHSRIALSVLATNDSAIKLYSRTGYKPERITMAKEIVKGW